MRKHVVFRLIVISVILCPVYAADAPSDVRVVPLLTTMWGQTTVDGNACFNYYTPGSGYPPLAPGAAANYPAGCVATAMAQVMNFHQWAVPQYGWWANFTIYADGSPYSVSLMGGSLGGAYDWGLMSDLSMAMARQEAGALLHDLGAALSMDYGSWSNGGSGTDFDYIDNVFTGFSYSNAVTVEGNYVSGGVLMPQSINPGLAELAIMTNLDAGLPVLIGINDQYLQSGHVLVLDGYGFDAGGTAWFHYNFGMPVQGVTPPATNLGWFTLPGVGTVGDSAGYDVLDGVAFNLFKAAPPVSVAGEIISGRVTDKDGNPLDNIQVDITSTAPGFAPVTVHTNAQGIFAAYGTIAPNRQYTVKAHGVGFVDSSQTCNVGISAKQWTQTSPPNNGYYLNTVGNVRLEFALAEGLAIPYPLPICDLDEWAGFAQFWNTAHSEKTDPDIRYDYNGDWRVDIHDLIRLVTAWLLSPPEFRTVLNIHFHAGDPMPADMPWQYAGSGGAWSVVQIQTPILMHAAESPAISDNQFTAFELPVKVLPGTAGTLDIQFQFNCDTEPGADVFEFLIDGVVQTEMGGMSAFSGTMPPPSLHYQVHNLTAPQPMVLQWRYTKDAANSSGADKVWIGDITIIAIP